jgi:hypothetical protein
MKGLPVKKFGKQFLVTFGLLFGWCAPGLAQSQVPHTILPGASSGEDAASRGVVPGQPAFYQSILTKECSKNPCAIVLDAVPAGRTLQATNLNCALEVASAGPAEQSAFFRLAQSDSTKGFFATKGAFLFTINEQIRVFFPSGSRPRVEGLSAGKSQMICTLSGTLLN